MKNPLKADSNPLEAPQSAVAVPPFTRRIPSSFSHRALACMAMLFLLSAAVQAQYITGTTTQIITSGTTSSTELTIYIQKYTGSGGNVTIPSTIEGLRVSDIGTSAFESCAGLKSITIPDSVNRIGAYAFDSCSGLKTVTIGNGVTSIGDSAFSYCNGLTSLSIGNQVATIGASAFTNCNGLTSLTLPNSLTSIGGSAFYYCNGLSNVTIPSNVTSIGSGAFSFCNGLNRVTIINGVTSIGDSAFSDCNGLTSLTIPPSVTKIGNSTFSNCNGLTSVTIPANVTTIGDSAFSHCSGLTSIVVSNGVTSIGASAFAACSGLGNVTIGNSVTIIGASAFEACTSLKNITIPDSVTIIGSSAFNNCPSLASAFIGDGVSVIKFSAFANCSSMTSLSIGDSVAIIESSAFSGCSSLNSLTFGTRLVSIGSHAFSGCSGLTSLTIPPNVSIIESSAFYGCSGLTSLMIGNRVNSIGSDAFFGCSKLADLVIGDSVTNIGSDAFFGCTSLTSLTIPASVTFIDSGAFRDCTGLTNIIFLGDAPSLGSTGAFDHPSTHPPVIAYLPGTIGWGQVFDDYYIPVLWTKPVVSSLSLIHGPAAGNTSVVINGYNFTAATSVKFGANPATLFTVLSDNQISASTPAGTAGQRVEVSVTTQEGTSPHTVGNGYYYNATSDVIAPKVVVTAPTGGKIGGSFDLIGLAFDNQGIDRVEVSLNGGSVQLATLGVFISGAAGFTLPAVTPVNGKNTIVIQAVDFQGNRSASVVVALDYPKFLGSYNGLLIGSGTTPSNNSSGFVTLGVTSAGTFTGKVTLGGFSLPVSGVFGNDGVAQFKPTLANSFSLVGKASTPVFFGNLSLSISGHKVVGTLKDTNSLTVANVQADRAYFDGKTPATTVDARLLQNKGRFNVVLPSKVQPGNPALSDYPQGHGFGTFTVNSKGICTLRATLADGSGFTASAPLSEDYHWPCYAQLYKKAGSIAGTAFLGGATAIGNIVGLDLLWFRPGIPNSKYYPYGWDTGITIDLLGCQNTVTKGVSFFPVLKPIDATLGNATIEFKSNPLVTKGLNINPVSDKVSNLSVLNVIDNTFRLSISGGGSIGGFFTDSDGTKPKFKGAIIQHDIDAGAYILKAGGYGYFLSTPPKVIGGTGESGAVILFAQ